MKRYIAIFLLTILFLAVPHRVFAWYGDYNYEVTDFSVNGNTATIKGWAIMNARGGGGFGNIYTGNKNRQSGMHRIVSSSSSYYIDSNGNKFVRGYCNYGSMKYYYKNDSLSSEGYNPNYTYQYQLEIYRVYENGQEEKVDIATRYTNIPTSLTYAQSYKHTSTNVAYFKGHPSSPNRESTACYENVGFQFQFDMSSLTMASNIRGYRLYLTIRTGSSLGCTQNCSERFQLNVVSGNFYEADVYFKNTVTKSEILLQTGYAWSRPDITSSKTGDPLDYRSTKYVIRNIQYDPNGYNWYQISKTESSRLLGWVPSPWINPAGVDTYLVPQRPQLEQVETCVTSNIQQSTVNRNVTCDGIASFDGSNVRTCNVTTSTGNFYNIRCSEELTTDMNPSVASFNRLGTGFGYEVDIKTKRICVGSFDYDAFKNSWDNVNENIDNTAVGSADYNENINKCNELKNILQEYNNWTSGNYTLNDVKTSLIDGVANRTINFVDKPGTSRVIRGNKTALRTYYLNIGGVANPIDFQYVEELSKTMQLPESYFNRSNNTVYYNNCPTCISLGNKYYISNSVHLNNNAIVSNNCYGCTYLNKFTKVITNQNLRYGYKVVISRLGENKSWSVETTDCALNVVSDPLAYRSIDLNDPFLRQSQPNREPGSNWITNSFDFTGIINSDVWNKNALYEFEISTKNIKDIKNNNDNLGINAYLGYNCYLNSQKNRYICSFLRDSQYFHKSLIAYDNLP